LSEREVRLQKLTQPELSAHAAAGATVLVPIGAIEQHGTHLPVETDVFNAETVSLLAAAEFGDVLVAPPIPWGLSHAHVELGGTLSLRPTTFLSLAMDLTESFVAAGFERLVWINGHHGNKPVIGLIVYESKRLHGLSVGGITYYDLAAEAFDGVRRSDVGGSGHACEFETSLMLHLRPEAVGEHTDVKRPIEARVPDDFRDLVHPGTTAIGYTFSERFPEGVMGDPTEASAATGEAILEASVGGVVRFLRDFRELPPRGVRAGSGGPGSSSDPG
jgi:creatinine amidohydrolase